MIFCNKCFKLEEIHQIIGTDNVEYGQCEADKSHGRSIVIDTEKDHETMDNIRNIITPILELYKSSENLPNDFPRPLKASIDVSLRERWPIFNIDTQGVRYFLELLYTDSNDLKLELLGSIVGIPQEIDENPDFRLLKTGTWDDFVTSIKHENRFFSDAINLNILEEFIRRSARVLSFPTPFYRCRINEELLPCSEMGAPGSDKASSGRLNPEGVSVLYLSNDKEACVREVRAGFHDGINYAQFDLNEPLSLVDLTNFEDNAFSRSDEFDDKELIKYFLNRKILKEISEEFAKPSNNSSRSMNYLPTQYISEFIKSRGYDGILYNSVMSPTSTNLVLFDEKKAIINQQVDFRKITRINYSHEI
ncbi:RES family NAD+ phosphorylase [Lactococcus garvieae]|nr:RES family NAD+ phosphorylase [Lactococcus garvieae]